jgi:hypothetical protein
MARRVKEKKELAKGDMHPIAQDKLAQLDVMESQMEALPVNTQESIAIMDTVVAMAKQGIPLPGAQFMRAENEALGHEIKTTRAQWRNTGVNKTKKRVVIEMLVMGTTKSNIVNTMGITPTACNSLFGDVRTLGLKITRNGDIYSLDKEQLRFFEDYVDLIEDEPEAA